MGFYPVESSSSSSYVKRDYDITKYSGRYKVYPHVDPYSIEIKLDEEDRSMVRKIFEQYEFQEFSPKILEDFRSSVDETLLQLYNRRYHLYKVFIEKAWYDENRKGIALKFACLESISDDWEDTDFCGLNDADKLAAIAMRRNPPSEISTQLYEYGKGSLTISTIFKRLERAHVQNVPWHARAYRNPQSDSFFAHESDKSISAVIFDEIVWQHLLQEHPHYEKLLDKKSGLGFIHGFPMFRVTPGSGYLPSGSLVIIVTDGRMTLRGSPKAIHQMLIQCDAGIVHYYDYSRYRAVGYKESRINI